MKPFFTFLLLFFLSYSIQSQIIVETDQLIERGDSAFYNQLPFTGKGIIYAEKTKSSVAVKKLTLDTKWIASEKDYNNGVLQKELRYFSEGEKHYEFNFQIGEYREWYDGVFKTEKLKVIGSLKKKQRHGKWTTYYKDGQISSEGNYTSDKQSGIWTYYHSNGKKSTEGAYKNGQMDGKWTYWDKEGKITSQEEDIRKLSSAKRKQRQEVLEVIALPFYLFMK